MSAFWIAVMVSTLAVVMLAIGLIVGSAPERLRKKREKERDLGTPWLIAAKLVDHPVTVWYQESGRCKSYTMTLSGEHPEWRD